MINKVILVGRLGADPEIRSTQSGKAVAVLSLATNERWKGEDGEVKEFTQWHRVVLWNGLAEIAEKYLSKGRLIAIEGSIRYREYEKDGSKQRVTEIVARDMKMLDRGKQKEEPAETGEAPEEEEDIPF